MAILIFSTRLLNCRFSDILHLILSTTLLTKLNRLMLKSRLISSRLSHRRVVVRQIPTFLVSFDIPIVDLFQIIEKHESNVDLTPFWYPRRLSVYVYGFAVESILHKICAKQSKADLTPFGMRYPFLISSKSLRDMSQT